jgi:predicted O-methyltransferase YrrM
MDQSSSLISIDVDAEAQSIATQQLGKDQRVSFQNIDGGDFIQECVAKRQQFDFIFADSWPGKFFFLDETLSLLKSGAFYLVDDLLPQANWPADHPPKVEDFQTRILARNDLMTTQLDWSTGLIMAVKK